VDAQRKPRPMPSPEELQHLRQLLWGYRASQALYAIAKLSVPDLLVDGPKDTEALAETTKTHAPSLYRLLRFGAGLGLLDEVSPRRFALTSLGSGLCSDLAGSLHSGALLWLDRAHWEAWGHLVESVQSGEVAFEHVHQMDFFDYLRERADLAAAFDETMTGDTARSGAAFATAYDWSDIGQVVDGGGGNGQLIATILQANAEMSGILFDRPEVVRGAAEVLQRAGVADRCTIVGGDFFESVPTAGDAYILRQIIHDWNDSAAHVILRNCRDAIPQNGKVLIVERGVAENYRQTIPALYSDLEMMVNLGGLQRTEAEYGALFADAHFTLTNVIEVGDAAQYSVFEGTPA
jgi:hypothetical protein